MAEYRLTHTARDDIVSILAWSHEQFGEEAASSYEALIATAIRDTSSSVDTTTRWSSARVLHDAVDQRRHHDPRRTRD